MRKLLLSSLLFLSLGSFAQSPQDNREKDLDRQILSLYQELTRAKELLSVEKIKALPANTAIQFIGSYPNRTGLKLTKYYVETEHKDKSRLKNSEEKTILLEFNGSTLSRIEIHITNEDTQIQQKSKTSIKDPTPLDPNMNDMQLTFAGLEGKNEYLLSDLSNEDYKPERNNFKRDFYIKFLLDFHSQLSTVIAMQQAEANSKHRKVLKELQGSLKY